MSILFEFAKNEERANSLADFRCCAVGSGPLIKLTKCRSLSIPSVLKLPLRLLATSRNSSVSEKEAMLFNVAKS